MSNNVYILSRSRTAFPSLVAKQLRELGERLQLARLRRRYSASTVAARADVTRMTLYKVERGDPGVSMGTYANVLRVLGLPDDLDLIARDDVLGRKLQDLELPARAARDEAQVVLAADVGPEACPVGTLYHVAGRGGGVFSFAYDDAWLRRSDAFEIDPGLQLVGGETYPANAAGVFRIFLDSAPDRWGR
eukprot:gene56786-77831_t